VKAAGDFERKDMEIVSFGGGVNSTAMIVGMKIRNERPDYILFADTGGEKPQTYDHIELMQKWLAENGFPLITTVKEKITLQADCENRQTLPSKAFGFSTCSMRFKVQPQERWISQNNIENPVWLVGIHAGEIKRALNAKTKKPNVRFPLIEWGWGQQDCEDAIVKECLPVPVKSACFFCPSMQKREVLQLKETNPELLDQAIEMERMAKEAGTLQTVKGLGRNWSWEALVSADEKQLRLFDDCQAPICDACIDW